MSVYATPPKLRARARYALAAAAASAVALVPAAMTSPAAGAAPKTVVVRAAADAYVRADRPARNFGRMRLLRAATKPPTTSYLRFVLPQPQGVVRRAKLRVLAARSSSAGFSVHTAVTRRWGEREIVAARAPAHRATVARSGRVRRGLWISIDVTRAVRGKRTVTLALSGLGDREVAVYSRQADPSIAPRLLVTTTEDSSSRIDPLIAAAGDIACDPRSALFGGGRGVGGSCRQAAVADVLADLDAEVVLPLGDLQYEDGRLDAFRAVYDQTWGRFKNITWPVVGNHEYVTPGAAGYFDYFNGIGGYEGRAGARDRGYYSFDVGSWHVIALNSVCTAVGGCEAGSAQEQWLRADLAAHPRRCTLAYWHHARFSSGQERSSPRTADLFRALYEAGADVVLTGHAHDYERFAPLTPDGIWDPQRGIRQFVVGTGGKFHYGFRPVIEPFSEVRDDTTWGVLTLRLGTGRYEWRFVPEAGGVFTDAGSGSCHQ
jgi:hypothetical protein